MQYDAAKFIHKFIRDIVHRSLSDRPTHTHKHLEHSDKWKNEERDKNIGKVAKSKDNS